MRISDWSSDVCSSDLWPGEQEPSRSLAATPERRTRICLPSSPNSEQRNVSPSVMEATVQANAPACFSSVLSAEAAEQDRKSVVQGKRVSVRVDLGGRRYIKQKQKQHDNDTRSA